MSAFERNGYGLLNVTGDVREWCEDWFSPEYHPVTRAQDIRHVVPRGWRWPLPPGHIEEMRSSLA